MDIMILEDDTALNKAICKVIELDNHNITSFEDGKEVLKSLDRIFDIYILDINVPNIDGLELLSMIRDRYANSKIIIISANTDIVSLKKAYHYGCIDYLKKPFHLDELRLKIQRLNSQQDNTLKISILKQNTTLTKKEKILLTLLLENKNKTLTYNIIENYVYGNKPMSMDSLRALVKRLRVKFINSDIIENVLDEGYLIRVK